MNWLAIASTVFGRLELFATYELFYITFSYIEKYVTHDQKESVTEK